jgi:predicted small metal-binding protein
MKTMNCRQVGGACEKEFRASSFDEIAEMSKQHGGDVPGEGRCSHGSDERNETADAEAKCSGGVVRKQKEVVRSDARRLVTS